MKYTKLLSESIRLLMSSLMIGFLIIIVSSCANKTKIEKPRKYQSSSKNGLVESYIRTTKHLSDTIIFSHNPDKRIFTKGSKQGKHDHYTEIHYDTCGIDTFTRWNWNAIVETYSMTYDDDCRIKEVRNYNSYDRPLHLRSIQSYNYTSNGLLDTFTYKDIRTQLANARVINTTHTYDDQSRLLATLVRRFYSGGYYNDPEWRVLDTINYFYNESEQVPFKVLKTAFEGTEYKINYKEGEELLLFKNIKQKLGEKIGAVNQNKTFKFDKSGRIIEYQYTEFFINNITYDPIYNQYTSRQKYTMTYNETNIDSIPIILDRIPISSPDLETYFHTTIEISEYPGFTLGTDLGFRKMPSKIEHYYSSDGDVWILDSITKRDSLDY